jgi:hypothetical protein
VGSVTIFKSHELLHSSFRNDITSINGFSNNKDKQTLEVC